MFTLCYLQISYSPFKSAKLAARAYDLMMCKETMADDPCLNFAQDHETMIELQAVRGCFISSSLLPPSCIFLTSEFLYLPLDLDCLLRV